MVQRKNVASYVRICFCTNHKENGEEESDEDGVQKYYGEG